MRTCRWAVGFVLFWGVAMRLNAGCSGSGSGGGPGELPGEDAAADGDTGVVDVDGAGEDVSPVDGSDGDGSETAELDAVDGGGGSGYRGAVYITELMVNPAAAPDTQAEWFELFNASAEAVDLQGWSLRDDGTDLHVIEDSLILEPGAFAVFATSSDPGVNGGLPHVDYAYPANELVFGNAGDQLTIEAPDGVVDVVAYAAGAGGWPVEEGRALSLRPGAHDDRTNDLPASWCAAPLPYGGGDFGSPGEANPPCDAVAEVDCADDVDNDEDGAADCADSDCAAAGACAPIKAGELVITEILVNPAALADTAGEWFEVYNAAEAPLDLRGLQLADDTGQLHVVSSDVPILVAPGAVAVLAAAEGALGGGASPAYVWGDGYSLGNIQDSIVLRSGSQVVDTVVWSAESGYPLVAGVALSLSGAAFTVAANDVAANWCLALQPFATGDLGTPGVVNPICIPAGCGNHTVEPPEACDDGNDEPGDGCEPDCTVTPGGCGDGAQDEGEDCDDGNTLSGDGCSSSCAVEAPLPAGTVVVTELMVNPDAVADAVGEWFEVHNPTATAVDLNGWTVADTTTDLHTIAPPGGALVIAPGGYVVLGRSADPILNGGVAVDYAYGAAITLTNTKDEVILKFAGGVVDAVAYAVPGWIVPKGASLQLDSMVVDAAKNDLPDSWCPSPLEGQGDAGSPGAPNAVCNPVYECGNGETEPGEQCDDGGDVPGDGCEPDCTLTPPDCGNGIPETGEQCDDGNEFNGDGCENNCTITPKSYPEGALIITEVMANPNAVPDALGEWIELYNTTGEAIDLTGWRLTDAGVDAHAIAPASPLFVSPGEHVVLGSGTAAQNGGVVTSYVYSSFSLSNTADVVRLSGPDNKVVDQISYGIGGVFAAVAGASARLDPLAYSALANDNPDSWCPSVEPMPNGDKGSPGVLNLPCDLAAGCGDGACKAGETCNSCPFDCGPCDMCAVTGQPGCGGCACESCVCAQDPSCCSVAWDAACVFACQAGCGGANCQSDGCIPSAVPGCEECECETCVCDADPGCCDVAWDDFCALLCEACGQDCSVVDGCTPTGEAGCKGCGCQACTCAQDPSCCTTAWDAECVGLCDACGGKCASQGCNASVLPGCNGCACEACVCTGDPFCCTVAWGPECVSACRACGQDCGSNGCNSSAVSGCQDCVCEVCVCGNDPFCCTDAWDAECVAACKACGQQCPEPACGNGLIEGLEECDSGILNSDTLPNACRTDCANPSCGDGVKDAGEACDDDNAIAGDGCSPACLVEVDFPAPGELVITEIMYNPSAVFDAQGEWFEVYNSTAQILNIAGLEVRDANGFNFFVMGNPQLLLQPGQLFVFGNATNMAINGGVAVDYLYTSAFVLNNAGGDTLSFWFDGQLIDAVNYSVGFPVASGASISLDPDFWNAVDNDDGSHWCQSLTPYGAGDFGTPGDSNAQCAVCGDGECTFGEECITCEADCGSCTNGCKPSLTPACGGCDCEVCVCTLDPSCCNLGWDAVCAQLCVAQCGGCPTTCGDGVKDQGEECDNGPANSNSAPNACRLDCSLAHCGDGVVDSGEQCDDGGTKAGDGCSPACVVEALPVNLGDLVITEVMQNPAAVSDALGEWFELYNASSKPIDLNGFAILDAVSDFHLITKSVIVQPKGFVVLGNNGNLATNGGVPVDYAYQGVSLSNASDEILIAFGGTVVDIIIYDNGATFPDPDGKSMSLDGTKLTAVANNAGSNWCLATKPYGAGDFGTPGKLNPPCVPAVCGNGTVEPGEDCDDGAFNSDTEPDACRGDCTEAGCGDGVVDAGEQCDDANLLSGDGCEPSCIPTFTLFCGNGKLDEGEECDDGNETDDDFCTNSCIGVGFPYALGALVITEIMIDPTQVDDPEGEWIEVYNPGVSPISLQFLRVSDAFGGSYKIQEEGVVPPKGYAVIAGALAPAANGGVQAAAAWKGALSLNNLGTGGIVLESSAGLVDSVFWDPAWPLGEGTSLNLDPQFLTPQANDVPATWCSGKAPYNALDRGTPGAPNTPCATPIECGNGLVEQGEECDDGGTVAGDGCDGACALEAKAPLAGQVVISEVMPDPSAVADDVGEWIELLNVSNVPVDLNGILLITTVGVPHTVNAGGPAILAPGEAWVLGRSTNSAINGGVEVDYAWGGAFGLKNTGDLIGLQSSKGIVDVAGYGLWPVFPVRPGVAAQTRGSATPALANDTGAGWCLADAVYGQGDRGTPGAPNTPCPPLVLAAIGDLVINELHPTPSVGDAGEFVEVLNTSAAPIDLRGLHMTDGQSEVHIIGAPEPVIVPAGGVAVLARSGDVLLNGGISPAYVYGGIDLDDNGDSIAIATPGKLFDEVTYFFPGFPQKLGATLSLEPSEAEPVANDEPFVWCLGATPYGGGDLGTPGTVNPPCGL